MKGQKILCLYNRKIMLEILLSETSGLVSVSNGSVVLPQEDISRLRRKLETTKKPDNVPKCDEILMEEIKDYKVRKSASVIFVLSRPEVVCKCPECRH